MNWADGDPYVSCFQHFMQQSSLFQSFIDLLLKEGPVNLSMFPLQQTVWIKAGRVYSESKKEIQH